MPSKKRKPIVDLIFEQSVYLAILFSMCISLLYFMPMVVVARVSIVPPMNCVCVLIWLLPTAYSICSILYSEYQH